MIRNGVVYRDSGAREGLAFYRDGSVKLYDETATNAQTLVNEGVWNTLSFGPALVKDSAIVDGIDSVEVDTNFGNHSIQGNQPRTGVGVLGTNHLVFIRGRRPLHQLLAWRDHARVRPNVQGPRLRERLQPGRWWLLRHGLQQQAGQPPAGWHQGTRHQRHPLHCRERIVIILIPAYKPDPITGPPCPGPAQTGPLPPEILVIDDGSGSAYAPILPNCASTA